MGRARFCSAVALVSGVACASTYGSEDEPAPPPPVADAGADATTDALDDGATTVDLGDDPDAAVVGDASTIPDGGKIVFISSKTYAADLGAVLDYDGRCNILSASIGLPGQYVAFIAPQSGSASTRFDAPAQWYRLDGTLVFDAIPNAQNAKAAVEINELGAKVSATAYAWTGENGTRCDSWSSIDPTRMAVIGDAHDASAWATAGSRGCDEHHRIYCFEK